MDDELSSKPSGLRPPSRLPAPASTSHMRPLRDLSDSAANTRSQLPGPNGSLLKRHAPADIHEPDPKRKSLKERAGEPLPASQWAAPPPSVPVSAAVKASSMAGVRSAAAATKFASSRPPHTRPPSASVHPRPPSSGRPQTSMAHSRTAPSSSMGHRPNTALGSRADEEAPERKRPPMRPSPVPETASARLGSIQRPRTRVVGSGGDEKQIPDHVTSRRRGRADRARAPKANPSRDVSLSTAFAGVRLEEQPPSLAPRKSSSDSSGVAESVVAPPAPSLIPRMAHASPVPPWSPTAESMPPPKTPGVRKHALSQLDPFVIPDTPFLTKSSNTRAAWDVRGTNARLEQMQGLYDKLISKVEQETKDRDALQLEFAQHNARMTTLEQIRGEQREKNDVLSSEVRSLQLERDEATYALEKLQRKQRDDEEDMERRHRREIEDRQTQWSKDADAIQRETSLSIESMATAHQQQLEEQNTRWTREMDACKEEHARHLHTHREQLDAAQQRAEQASGSHDRDVHDLRDQLAKRAAETLQRDAVIDALRNAMAEAEEASRQAMAEQERTSRSLLADAQTRLSAVEAERDQVRAKASFLESDSQAQSRAFADIRREADEALALKKAADEQTAMYLDKLRQEETRRRKLFNQVQELKGNIRVFCRVRPALEEAEDATAQMTFPDETGESKELVVMGAETTSALGKVSQAKNAFSFDRVFAPSSHNPEIFDEISQLVQSALDGYNVCIFCYGQTGSGKTFTMSSPTDGMIPLAVHQIFSTVHELHDKGWSYQLEGSFVEVYNENLNDLLGRAEDLDKKKMTILHDKGSTTITDVEKIPLDSAETIGALLARAAKNRSVAATKANERSSRSHSIFILTMLGTNRVTGETSRGTLNLVDLAGSERLAHSQAEGARLKETQNINRSLSCLGDVISALGSRGDGGHVPYRNSKLTYLLQNSLGGNSKTLMMVMVSSMREHLGETLGSLRFATKVHHTHIGTAKKSTKVKE